MAGPSEENGVMEVREEEMVSPRNGDSSLRIAYFLWPSVSSTDGPVFDPPIYSVKLTQIENSEHLKANFVGWRHPKKDWREWVDSMQSLHHSTWKRAGIHDAILSSTFKINRNDDLILGIAEKWCSETNTFVFPWGEATITLEDMMILGGFSVLGDSVLSPHADKEMEMVIDNLHQARSDINDSKANYQRNWMKKFMDSGSEIEHEAFLAYWLSRYVFPCGCRYGADIVLEAVIPITAHLARGTKIALAPAVLARTYKNLSSLKDAIVAFRKKLGIRKGHNDSFEVKVTSPLQLVQAWVWERFPALQPKPNSTASDVLRLGRWHRLKQRRMKNVLLTMDCSGQDFVWRPYTMAVKNSLPLMVYREKGYWILVDSCLAEEFVGLVRCLRTCELIGLEIDCIEQYLPHRVAMQFGMDQDLPGYVARVNGSWQIAWSNYNRAIGDSVLYIPARLFESHVTMRYLKWWSKLRFSGGDMTMANLEGTGMSSGSRRKEIVVLSEGKREGNDLAPPGLASKTYGAKEGILGSKRKEMEAIVKTRLEDDYLPPPPGFSPKYSQIKEGILCVKNKNKGGELSQDESNGISLNRKDAYRQSTLLSANDEADADFHRHQSSERSTGKAIENSSGNGSDKNSHVLHPLGFKPEHTRIEEGQSACKNKETDAQLPEGEHDESNLHQKEHAETELKNKLSIEKRAVLDNSSREHEKSCKQTTHEAPWLVAGT